jgi:hypothetical protein
MSSTETFTYSSDLIPSFSNENDLDDLSVCNWNKIGETGAASQALLNRNNANNDYYIQLMPYTLQSNSTTFVAVARDEINENYTSSDKFNIKKITIKLNEILSKYIRLLSVGVNTSSTVTASYSDFLLTKESDHVYSVSLSVDTFANTSEDPRFRLYIDSVPIPFKTEIIDGEQVQTGGFEQVSVFNDLSRTHFASIQYSGNYVIAAEDAENKNQLQGTNHVKVQEYSRLLSIYENDAATPAGQQFSMIGLKNVKYSLYRRPFVDGNTTYTRVYRMRTYELGSGELLEAKISGDTLGSTFGATVSHHIKINGGELISIKAVKSDLSTDASTNSSQYVEQVVSFKLTVPDSELSKLPNKYSNVINVYDENAVTNYDGDYSVTVEFSNPL